MWFSVSEHLTVTLYSALMGLLLGVVYDFIKTSRVILGVSSYSRTAEKLSEIKLPYIRCRRSSEKRKRKKAFAVIVLFVGDIFYSVISAAIYSLFLFHAIRGQVRWYFLLATAIAFFLYYFTVSRFVLVVIEVLFFGCKVMLIYLREIALLPFRLIVKLVIKAVSVIKSRVIIPAVCTLTYRRNAAYTEKTRLSLESQIKFKFYEL